MLMTITGKLGSGKSTVCDIIQAKYGFDKFSTGLVQRKYAENHGLSTLDLNKNMDEAAPTLDNDIDSRVARMSRERKGDKLIFDSRMAWHFAEDTFKIFLTVDPQEAGRRVFYNRVSNVECYTDEVDACEKLLERSEVERQRFIKIYGVDYFDYNNYNVVVDTTSRAPEEVVAIIMENYELYKADPDGYGSVRIFA